MNILIVVNGELPNSQFLEVYAKRFDSVVVTDGATTVLPLEVSVNTICGDFDSITVDAAQKRFPSARIIVVSDQNLSDLEKALNYALEQGAKSLTLVGALGGRIDHSLVSISMVLKHHGEIPISLVDAQTEMILLSPHCVRQGRLEFPAQNDAAVSLISLVPSSEVTISGVHWPLRDHTLCAGSHGVSNRALGGLVTVAVTKGCVAVTRPLATADSRQMNK